MSEARTVLFRLSNLGEPINNENIANGVLILPVVELPSNYKPGDALFQLRFQLNAASKVSRNGTLYTNVPSKCEQDFDRNTHYQYPIKSSFHEDITITVPIYKPGSYNYYIEYDDEEDIKKTTEKYYFNVPPNLTINGKFVPFNNVNVETVVSKWIGPYENWDKFFKIVAQKGYNMIHFTPLQERGESDSPYSIYDQLKFDPKIFPGSDKDAIQKIHKVLNDNQLLSLTDVVWNHTANNSEWLREHPDSGYNATTAPHLIPAIELDKALLEFSHSLQELGLPTVLESEADLQKVMDGIQTHVLDKLKLWEYYVFNKRQTIVDLEKSFNDNKNNINKIQIPNDVDSQDLKQLSDYVLKVANINPTPIIGDRFANKLNVDKFLGVLFTVFDNNVEFETIANRAEEIIDEINSDLYAAFDDDTNSIKQRVADRIKYLRLADNGPKLGEITDKSPLTEPYFTRFTDVNGKKQALANNGWI